MPGMLAEAGIRKDLVQVVTFGTEGVGPVCGQVRVGEQVYDRLTGSGRLAELIVALEQMNELRSVRTIGASTPELPIVVAVMAVGAEDAYAHIAARRSAIQIEHLRTQAGLWQSAAAVMSNGMARTRGGRELRNDVERVSCRCRPHREISVFLVRRL